MARVHLTKHQIFVSLGILVFILAIVGAGALAYWLQHKDAKPAAGSFSKEKEQPVPDAVVEAQKLGLQGKTDEATKKLEEALNQPSVNDNDKHALYVQQAATYSNSKQHQKALDTLRLAEKIRLDFTVAHLIAEQAEALGDKPTAIDYYKKAISLMNNKSPLYNADKKVFEAKIKELGGTP